MGNKILVPVEIGDIRLDEPLNYPLYDQRGRLLLRQGLRINSDRFLEHLQIFAMKELEAPPGSAPAEVEGPTGMAVFQHMEGIAQRLGRLYREERKDPENPYFIAGIRAVAQMIQDCCTRDGDASFAEPHLDHHHDYDTIHHLMTAVICARIAAATGWSDSAGEGLIAASLTEDIALLPYRQALEANKELSPELKDIVRQHAENGVDRLRHLGVTDEHWLRGVREHHEALNGTGYPQGLPEPAIGQEGRILALADAFCAMLRPRPYRSRIPAKKALADLYINRERRYDPQLVGHLIRELGIYPPGSVVRLASNEIGIVARNRFESLHAPEVQIVFDSMGHQLYHPLPREVGDRRYAIVALLEPEVCQPISQRVSAIWSDVLHPPQPHPPALRTATPSLPSALH